MGKLERVCCIYMTLSAHYENLIICHKVDELLSPNIHSIAKKLPFAVHTFSTIQSYISRMEKRYGYGSFY